MTLAWIILGMGVVSLLLRGSSILLLGQRKLPGWLAEALALVPAAVLSALVFPELLLPGGQLLAAGENPRLWAGLIAIAVAWRTRNVLWTLGSGMLALWLLQALLGGAQ
ncbi:branched-subunit amino acid transport protein [Deinobacterium chartae]|uniref:Branched-subunit amino acid transport protein n=1 Tax=Deinobacterium chartae TaxID=521158 RepID=A0A841I7Z9_9DEIO|nr:AzlD domain-containing protein [Deinobacterium chartae]MBB6099962.1 branched-subunit amino acid transport protein [Deinobacterium chartae]